LKFLFLASLSFVCACGCAPSAQWANKLVGKWTMGTGETQITVEFAKDGRFALNSHDKKMSLWATTLGTYTASGDSINFTYTDARLTADDPKDQPGADMVLKMTKQKLLDVFIKNDSVDKVTWKTNDEFIMTDSKGKPETLDRVKT
jgi:uncharacterized protein (TIGR03066 family)